MNLPEIWKPTSNQNHLKVCVSTHHYEIAHRRAPRGKGTWAFCPESKYKLLNYIDFTIFLNGTYAEAKAKACEMARAAGIRSIVVGS